MTSSTARGAFTTGACAGRSRARPSGTSSRGDRSNAPLWDGQGNLEEYEATLPDGTRLRGLALRLYNPKARRWTIHWSNSANGTLDPPMTGAFHEALGVFYSHEEYEGRMILVRFHWRSLPGLGALGASVFGRRRRDVGGQLDHGVAAGLPERDSGSPDRTTWSPGGY